MTNFKAGDKVWVKETPTKRVAAIILRLASYAGRSGQGYDAAYDPPRSTCSMFWTHDNYLEART